MCTGSGPERSEAQSSRVDLGRQAELGAELLRLRERAPHQRLPRDAGRKAEIVLDARAGAGLSSKRERFQHQDREALGRAVDRGREPGRTRADDGHVVRFGAEARRHQAQRARQLLLRRILEHRAVRQDRERKLARLRRRSARAARGVPILIGIDHAEGNPVAFEEVRQPRHVRGLERPDEHRASEADLDQRHAAQDERAQDALAELGLGDEQRPQRLRRNDDRLHVADRPGVDRAQVRPSGELPELGHDLARDDLRHLLERRPDQLRERRHRHRSAPAHRAARSRPGRKGSRTSRGPPLPRGRGTRRQRTAGPRRNAGRGRSRRRRGPGTSGGTATPGPLRCGRPGRGRVPRCLVLAPLVVESACLRSRIFLR